MKQQLPELIKQAKTWVNRQPRWLIVVGLIVCLAAGLVLMNDTRSPSAAQSIPGVETDPYLNSTSLALGVFVRLILVVIAIYIAAILFRRWQMGGKNQTDRQLALIETLHLNQRRSIHLVRAGDQVFLIGATDQEVSLLGKISPQSDQLAAPTQPSQKPLSFDQHLSFAIQQQNGTSEIETK
jgi:flagellar biosynthetic protein FliO